MLATEAADVYTSSKIAAFPLINYGVYTSWSTDTECGQRIFPWDIQKQVHTCLASNPDGTWCHENVEGSTEA